MHNDYAEYIEKLDDLVWSDEREVWTSSRPLVLEQVPRFSLHESVWRAKEGAKAKAREHDVLQAKIQSILEIHLRTWMRRTLGNLRSYACITRT